MTTIRNFCALASLILIAIGSPQAAESDGSKVYVTPQEAAQHPAFSIQGEYHGDDLGVQVVALGDDQFRIVRYEGGLPGDGSDAGDQEISEGDASSVRQATEGLKRVVRTSPTLGKEPPKGAVVLFDGTDETLREQWKPGASMTSDGLLVGGCTSRDVFQDFSAHLEFRTPFMPQARGQRRGNSGAYWQGRFETQVLDSFGLKGAANECGGIYSVSAPKLNMCFPPLVWQTYDVDFTAARYDSEGKKISDAKLAVRLNGVLVQDDVSVPEATRAAPLEAGPSPGPLYLQDHGDPVRFRNVWIKPK